MDKKLLKAAVDKVRGKPHGKNFHHSKLTPEDVQQIRSLKYVISGVEIAKIFGITNGSVSEIQLRKTWKHLP